MVFRLALVLSCWASAAWGWNAFQSRQGQSLAQGVLAPSLHAASNHSAPSLEFFSPAGHLSALREDEYTTMSHPLFSNYNVRIKKAGFCDTTVNSYTGYIDIEARHLFFYFFESRSDPSTDDVIFWTNGGPGCSSSVGLFMELGPCRISDEEGPKYHSRSWNTNANIFFIDQPIGVGYSYADHGESVGTTEDAAKDIAAFVAIFFENFPQFKGRGFHMAGESYGGRYIPLFASAVYDQNTALVQAGLTPINLQSIMIGNGMTDIRENFLSMYDVTCTPASVAPVLDIAQCVSIKATLDRCDHWIRSSCEDQQDMLSCGAAGLFCFTNIMGPFAATGLNVYDMSKPCEGGPDDLCYPVTKHISNYLSKPSTWRLLGVDPAAQKPFKSCSETVSMAFRQSADMLHPTKEYVAALLERKIRVLIYVGTYDFVCNHVGNERWTSKLEWSGRDAFASQPLREWRVMGSRAGKTRSANGFTFATIEGAGHMVPYDKPVESLSLIQRWLAKEDL